MYWFSRRMVENTEMINLINIVCNRKYGILMAISLLPIVIITLQLLNAIDWLAKSNTYVFPDYVAYYVARSGYSLFTIVLWIANGLYDPISTLISIFIYNLKRAKVNSLLAGGVVEPQ